MSSPKPPFTVNAKGPEKFFFAHDPPVHFFAPTFCSKTGDWTNQKQKQGVAADPAAVG
jgi:hypothetical protein